MNSNKLREHIRKLNEQERHQHEIRRLNEQEAIQTEIRRQQ